MSSVPPPPPAFHSAVLSGAIAAAAIGGILIGLVAGLVLRPLLNHRRLNPKLSNIDAEKQEQQHQFQPTEFYRIPAYIPPSAKRLRDSRPVYQFRPDATIRPPPRTLQLGRRVSSVGEAPLTQGDSKRISFLQNHPHPASAPVDSTAERSAAPPLPQRTSMCRSTIEYISSPATSTDAETSVPSAQRGRSASTASLHRRLPAAFRVPSEKALPHPWNATRRGALWSARPGTAESADSSRFLPQPLGVPQPIDDSTVDEMSVRMTSGLESWDRDLARDSAFDMSPEADSLRVPTTLPPALATEEEHPLRLLSTSPARPAQQPYHSTLDRSSGLWSPEVTPSAWEYDGAASCASSRHSPSAPLLLFLPPASPAASTYSEASAKRGSTFVRSSDETWGEEEEMTRSSSAVASSDVQALVTLDEMEEEGEDHGDLARTSVDGMLDEMLMAAPVGAPEWRPVKAAAAVMSAAHARAASIASTATTIRLKWQASQDTLNAAPLGARTGIAAGARLMDGYRSLDPPDSPRDAGVDSESDEPEVTATAASAVYASIPISTSAPFLAPLVFQRPSTHSQSRRPKTSPVGRAREAHHVLAPPALGPGFTHESLELGMKTCRSLLS